MNNHNRVWTTDRVDARQAFSQWQSIVCNQWIELDLESECRTQFRASLSQRELGPLMLNTIRTTQQDVWRTEAAITRSSNAPLFLIHERLGTLQFEHYGTEFTVAPGACVLVDSSHAYHFSTSAASDCLSIEIPHKWLQMWMPYPEDAVGKVITPETPWARALLEALAALDLDEDLSLPATCAAEQLAALLVLTLGTSTKSLRKSQRDLIPRIRDVMYQKSHEETLSPAEVAQQFDISKRYLHSLFAGVGSTFGGELMKIRLGRAARLLRDPRFSKISNSQIAWRCGFADSSHFARRFRLSYGVTPTAFRRGSGGH